MKLLIPLVTILIAAASSEQVEVSPESVAICIESTSQTIPLSKLAEVRYDPRTLSAEVISFNTPSQFSEDNLVRLGSCDATSKAWKSSTSVTSAATFSKGYSPIIILHINSLGDVFSVSCKSGRVDAGHTRDFGPKAQIVRTGSAKEPELNKPVVLSKEGKIEAVEPEKSFLQKYWMVFLGITVVLMMSGGGDK